MKLMTLVRKMPHTESELDRKGKQTADIGPAPRPDRTYIRPIREYGGWSQGIALLGSSLEQARQRFFLSIQLWGACSY